MTTAQVLNGDQTEETDPSSVEQRLVKTRRNGAIAVLRLSNPPVNRVTDALRAALFEAIEAADLDPEIQAIVLAGEGAPFCTGYAADALTATEAAPTLVTLCDRIEACGKPVVAAMHGATLEAGLALALAAHFRIMGQAARAGAPEVSFGLVPGGGVTQRLPRLVGAGAALDIMLSGQPISGVQAHKIGLVDKVVAKGVRDAALAFTRQLIETKTRPTPSQNAVQGVADGAKFMKDIAARRDEIRRARVGAPNLIIDCVEAALMMPFSAGVRREQAARDDCFASPQFAALRYAFFAERHAARLVEPDGIKPHGVTAREVKTLGVVGTGALALGITVAALDNGLNVRLLGNGADQLVVAETRITSAYTRAAQQGQITYEVRDARVAAFTASNRVDSLASADLVIEATQGDAQMRGRLLGRLEEFLPEEVVLATGADRGFAEMAKNLAHPERFLGLHFFAPAQAVRAVELARADGVAPDAVATAHGFLRRLGKIPVTVVAQDGLIANVVQEAGWAAVDVLLLMGVRPARIDKVMWDYGFPAGPCETMDALGLSYMSGAVAQYFASEGRGGKAAGRGFYDYAADSSTNSALPDGALPDDTNAEALLTALRKEGGIPILKISDREIVDRIVLAQANAGAILLERGVTACPEDIDVMMMLSKGYPRWRGGPMKAADDTGILEVEKRLMSFADAAPDIWQPATIWREMIKNGRNFGKMNRI